MEERKDEEQDKKSFQKLLHNFMGYTTAHGAGRLAESKAILGKIFWTIACLGAFSMFIMQGYGLFQLYLSRPVSTSVKILFKKKVPFPAVTVCNLNSIRKDALPPSISALIKDNLQYSWVDFNDTAGPPSNFSDVGDSGLPTASVNNGNDQENPDLQDYYEDHRDDYSDEDIQDTSNDFPDPNDLDMETKLRTEINTMLAGLDPISLHYSGHLFEKLIVNCTWIGLDCKSGNLSKSWKHSWNYEYGNCYTFNSGSDEYNKPVRTLKSSKSGIGLVLRLNIEQDQYLPLSAEAGVRVALETQGDMPFPNEKGFSISPGTATSVALKKTEIIRLDRFGNKSCLPANDLSGTNIYRKFKNATRYSKQACLNSCLGLSQFSICKCSEYFYPSEKKPCNTSVAKTRNCLKLVQHLFNFDKLECLSECRHPCREEVIEKTISSSNWPSKAYQKYLDKANAFSIKSYNGLLLNIFYSELNYERIEEEYSYGSVNLLADIGGQLGLWIGISVITCCEVLELFMMFFCLLVEKCKKKSQQAQTTQVTPFGQH